MKNQITNYLKNVREFIKTGGWTGSDIHYSFIKITYRNGDVEFIQQADIEEGNIPSLVSSKIKEIYAWWSGGFGFTPTEEIITKESYWSNR